MPTPLLAEQIQWKKVSDPELGLDKDDVIHGEWGSCVHCGDTTLLQFFSACHNLHTNASVYSVSNILILHAWQNEIGRPLRWVCSCSGSSLFAGKLTTLIYSSS